MLQEFCGCLFELEYLGQEIDEREDIRSKCFLEAVVGFLLCYIYGHKITRCHEFIRNDRIQITPRIDPRLLLVEHVVRHLRTLFLLKQIFHEAQNITAWTTSYAGYVHVLALERLTKVWRIGHCLIQIVCVSSRISEDISKPHHVASIAWSTISQHVSVMARQFVQCCSDQFIPFGIFQL